MNYSELLTNVRDYTEVDSSVLSDPVIDTFLINVENKIDRTVDSDAQRRYATTSCQVDNAFIDLTSAPSGFRFARAIQIVKSNGERDWMEQVDTTFIDEYSVTRSDASSSTNGIPKFWANWDQKTLILAPTPDEAYTLEMWYDETPERLSSTNTTTYISNNAPEVLLYGVLSEAYSYLKNPQEMQLYQQKFQASLSDWAQDQMGRKRRDEYTDGVLRIPLRSVDPGGK